MVVASFTFPEIGEPYSIFSFHERKWVIDFDPS